ncbi:hypothetical protein A9E74_00530 [Methylophaga muralis]|uniref:Uncharacterized protein n=2 Tax=Methylophaga muralis TaxID=291169 RepID=A0A1E3GUH0_9GAMM|nr:hypothetical protein A9E74_00530 [Methylophaga muralis]
MVSNMTVNFFSGNSFLLSLTSRQAINQLLGLFIFCLMLSIPVAQANEENTESFVTEFAELNEANLPTYVSKLSHRYYEQVELLGKYFQLYQQKRDPRGFNVWHLRGFTPSFDALNDESQQVAKTNEKFLANRPEQALSTIVAELRDVSVNLMLAFRENDPQAFKAANAMVKEHGDQIAALLKTHNLNEEIREISLK